MTGTEEAYVPMGTSGYSSSSGVTVLCGIDLPQQTASEMLGYGFTQDQVSSMSQFLGYYNQNGVFVAGIKGDAAAAALESYRNAIGSDALDFTDAVQDFGITNAIITSYYNKTQDWYNGDSGGYTPANTFQNLPTDTKLAIVDLYYSGDLNSAYNIVGQIKSNDWAAAITDLGNWNGIGSDPATSHFLADRQLILHDLTAQ